MAGLHFVYMISFYLLKPARDSLFLIELGAMKLPAIYIIMAIVAIPVIIFVSKLLQRSNIFLVLNGTIVFLVANLIILRIIIPIDQPWVYYLFYIWVSLYGIFITSQFWLFANYLFNTAQSKRLFGMLNVGAILGAIVGSELSNLLIDKMAFKTESLLYFCMGSLVLGLALINRIYKEEQKSSDNELLPSQRKAQPTLTELDEPFSELFKSIYKSRYQVIILLIVATTMIASTFVDFQFKSIAVDSYTERSELTSFMGRFYAWLSLAALVVQLFFSHFLIHLGGVGAGVITRPLILVATTSFLLFNPTILSASLMRGLDGGLRYSIDKTGRELLFLALPQKIKRKTKIFIDVFVDRVARGIGGFALLLFVVILGFSVEQLSYIVMGVIAFWLLLAWMAKIEYVNQFRSSILKHQIQADRYDLQVHDQVTLKLIRETLNQGSDSQILYALNLLETPVSGKMVDCLKPLLNSVNAQIRLKALKLLIEIQDVSLIEEVAPLLRDKNLDVRLEAILYICEHSDSSAGDVMAEFIDASEIEIKSSALACISRHGDGAKLDHLNQDLIEELLSYEGEDQAIIYAQTAIALKNAETDLAKEFLPRLLNNESTLVVRETLKTMGALQIDDFIALIMEKLCNPEVDDAAIEALARYGPGKLTRFLVTITDKSKPFKIRQKLFQVFANIPCQRSIDYILQAIIAADKEHELRIYGIKALNKLRTAYNDQLTFDENLIDHLLFYELHQYYNLLSILDVIYSDKHGDQRMLLVNAIQENMDATLERIFRLIGLEYPPNDIYGAYLSIRSLDSEQRAEAIEFLDNLISNELKSYLFPIIDPKSNTNRLEAGKELFDVEEIEYEEGLLKLLEGRNRWLKICAVYFVSPNCPSILREKVREFTKADDDILRETAQLVMQQHNNGTEQLNRTQ